MLFIIYIFTRIQSVVVVVFSSRFRVEVFRILTLRVFAGSELDIDDTFGSCFWKFSPFKSNLKKKLTKNCRKKIKKIYRKRILLFLVIQRGIIIETLNIH